MRVDDFWSKYELTVGDFESLQVAINKINDLASTKGRKIAWRGQTNSNWALTSRLYRVFIGSQPQRINETEFSKIEQNLLVELRRWGLHSQRDGGRLSVLSQLAMLQHFGTPTRLIDISFNALVSTFFATEYDDKQEQMDGRLFAVDITDRLLNENKALRSWEDSLDRPWSDSFKSDMFRLLKDRYDNFSDLDEIQFKLYWTNEWNSHYFVWKPPSLNPRIAAQNGGFLFGGLVGSSLSEGFIDFNLPRNRGSFQIANPEPTESGKKWLSLSQVREITCIAITPTSIERRTRSNIDNNCVYSIKIAASAKGKIRRVLDRIYGYNHSTIYPDYTGFSSYGAPRYLPKQK
jgi:hypothetical protein